MNKISIKIFNQSSKKKKKSQLHNTQFKGDGTGLVVINDQDNDRGFALHPMTPHMGWRSSPNICFSRTIRLIKLEIDRQHVCANL